MVRKSLSFTRLHPPIITGFTTHRIHNEVIVMQKRNMDSTIEMLPLLEEEIKGTLPFDDTSYNGHEARTTCTNGFVLKWCV